MGEKNKLGRQGSAEKQEISLSDIFDVAELQNLQDLFAESHGVASLITQPDGTPITNPSNFTRICTDIIRQTETGCENCLKSGAVISCQNSSGPNLMQCISGSMWDAGASITVGGKHIANWIIGQVRDEQADHSKLINYAREIGADQNEFLEAFAEVPVMSAMQFEKVANLLFVFVNLLSEKAFANLQLKKQIAEKEEASRRIQESEERWKRAVSCSPIPIMIHSEDNVILQLSEGWTSFSGYTIEDIPTMGDWTERAYGERYGLKKNYIDELFLIDRTKKNGEWIVTTKAGSKRVWDFQTTPLGRVHEGKRVLQSIAVDVTDQKHAEELFRQEQLFSATILESLPGIFYLYSYPELKLLRWNKNHETRFGYISEEMEGLHLTNWHSPEAYEAVISAVEIAMKEGQNVIETSILTKNKVLVPYILTGSKLEAEGKLFLMGVGIDITDRQTVQEKLKESEQSLQFVLQGSQLGYWDWNLETGEVKRNERWAEMLGYKLEDVEFTVKQWIDFIHPDDQDMALKSIQDHLDGITPMHRIEYRMQTKDGHYVWILDQAQAVKWDSNGKVIRMSGTHTDITVRKIAEEKLRNSNAYLENLINYANAPIIVWDSEFRITRFNRAFEILTGRKEADVIGKSLHILFPSEKLKYAMELIQLTLKGQRMEAVEIEILHLDGSVRTVLWNSATVLAEDGRTPILNIAQGQDITERNAALELLKVSLVKYQVLFEAFPVGITISDAEGKITEFNSIANDILGLSKDEMEKRKIDGEEWRIIRPDGTNMPASEFASVRAVAENKPVTNVEMGIVKGENNINWLNVSAAPIPLKTKGVAIVYNDISEKRQTEINLQQEQFFSKSLLDSLPGIFYLYSYPELNLVRWNKNYENILGYSFEELNNWSIYDWIKPELREPILEATQKTMEEGQFMLETNLLTKDRQSIPFVLSGARINLQGKDYIMGVGIDATELKEAEEEVKLKNLELAKINAEKDKFFSIIAHDLRSPFSSFLGLTQIMAEELPSLDMNQVQNMADTMNSSASNLYRLLENLLQWSQIHQGQFPFKPQSVNLLHIADECISMIEDSARAKKITIFAEVPESIQVYADSDMLQAILRNLISNALKFTFSEGQISVKARLAGDNQIEISIHDTGIGMNREMLENLFRIDVQINRKGTQGEPSTGLGLVLCKEFVEKHAGKIWAESEEGNGSVFYFTIPAAE